MTGLTVLLHVLQPAARLAGRLRGGVSPWRKRCSSAYSWPYRQQAQIWSEEWHAAEDWLASLESRLQSTCHAVARGGDSDRWDLQVRGGALGVVRVLFALEEHGQGRQLARLRCWPRYSRALWGSVAALIGLAGVAVSEGSLAISAVLGAIGLTLVVFGVRDCAAAAGSVLGAIREPPAHKESTRRHDSVLVIRPATHRDEGWGTPDRKHETISVGHPAERRR
jgi:hypothetical protein